MTARILSPRRRRWGRRLGTGLVAVLITAAPAALGQIGYEISIETAPGVDPADILDPDGPRIPADTVGGVAQADKDALRYYSTSGQLDRFEAELRRIQTLNPGWLPPPDLLATGPLVDEQPVWDHFGRGALDEARAVLAELRRSNPGWTPSSDLLTKLVLAQERRRLRAAAAAGQWTTVLNQAREHPALIHCNDLEIVWDVADAHAQLGERAAALIAYRRIIDSCRDEAGWIATVEKASRLATYPEILGLTDRVLERAGPGGRTDTLIRAITRVRLGAFVRANDTERLRPPEPATVRAFADAVWAAKELDGALILGWYHHTTARYPSALEWFRAALAWQPDSVGAMEGTLAVLLASDRAAEAERLGRGWLDRGGTIRSIYLDALRSLIGDPDDPPPDEDAIAQAVAVAGEDGAPDLALALGWHFCGRRQWANGVTWFKTALERDGGAEAAKGLALCLHGQGNRAARDRVTAEWRDRSPELAELARAWRRRGRGGRPDPVAQALARGRHAECVRQANAARGTSRYTADTALSAGWCLIELDRPTEAEASFADAVRLATSDRVRRDARYGQVVALNARGLTERAIEAAQGQELEPEQRRDLSQEWLETMAWRAVNAGQYGVALRYTDRFAATAVPTRSIRMARGWALYHLRRLTEALRVFRAVDREFSTRESRNALAVVARRLRPD